MYKNTQKKDNETITPDKERICETTDKMKPSKKPVQHIRKVLTTSAVMCCIIAILAAVLFIAASFEDSYRLMYTISPSAAQFFTPVMESSTANDVELRQHRIYRKNIGFKRKTPNK